MTLTNLPIPSTKKPEVKTRSRSLTPQSSEGVKGTKRLKRSSSLTPRKIRKDGNASHKPISIQDFEDYKFVLPSERSINRQKLCLATQCELDAAIALLDIQSGIKSTLHYDTTTRCGIDGEWVSLILSLSDGRRYRLRPIYLAYEDRDNIIRYIVESYQRLAIIASNVKNFEVKAVDLWKKTAALMTDAVSKNLNVHSGISAQLNTDYIPLHLLCKSHTVEGLDRSNIQVLSEVERTIQFRDKVEAVNPAIKRFTRGEKCVVVAGIKSVLNLISHEKSASPTNIAHLFDVICEREGAIKHMSLYQERRFAKLGYVAGSILDAIPLLTMLINDAPNQNLHTESVRIYIECEFFSTALAVLSYFSYKVSLPLLNCIENSSQSDLCTIFPKLHEDLLAGNTNTLSDFVVKRSQYQVSELSSNLEKLLLKKFCTHAAAVIKLQCGREYFSDESAPARVDKDGLPTNNLLPECDFSVFDRLSRVARMANRKFWPQISEMI